MPLRALVVDFNSYFASVEQVLASSLRGRPIGVVPVVTDSTCCIAASSEAKRHGVKTGTGVAEARSLCPGIIFVESQPEEYIRLHHLLVAAVESCTHVEEVWSIDEMWCRLTGRQCERANAEALARNIKAAVANVATFARDDDRADPEAAKVLTCSVGIAPNGYLAKTATDMQKPDGLVFLEDSDLPHKLHRLQLRDFCGIGRNMEHRLLESGIFTVAQLCAATEKKLREVWNGIEGTRMYRVLRGEEVQRPPTQKRVLGHSHVLPPELRTEEGAFSVCHRLIQKAAMRLRKGKWCAGGLQLSVKYSDRRWSDDITFTPTQDTLEFLHTLDILWQRCRQRGISPKAVGVTLFHLVQSQNSTPVFPTMKRNHSALLAAMDAVNIGMGKNKVYFGGAHGALAYTPMRIAFNRIPDLETER